MRPHPQAVLAVRLHPHSQAHPYFYTPFLSCTTPYFRAPTHILTTVQNEGRWGNRDNPSIPVYQENLRAGRVGTTHG